MLIEKSMRRKCAGLATANITNNSDNIIKPLHVNILIGYITVWACVHPAIILTIKEGTNQNQLPIIGKGKKPGMFQIQNKPMTQSDVSR